MLAIPISLVPMALGVLLRPVDLSRAALGGWARRLAGQVQEEWNRARNQLLADTGAATPADLEFRRSEETGLLTGTLVRWRADGGDRTGSLADIAGYFASLRRGRLVVLGAPGAGKTVLAIQFLLDRMATLPEDDTGAAAWEVPVLVSLPSWHVREPDGDDTELYQQLVAWIVSTLTGTYRLPAAVARAMVDGGWVLPVLDGLDEMDAEAELPAEGPHASAGPARRALATVRALNYGVGRPGGIRRFVITCREHRYRELIVGPDVPGRSPAIQDATVITLQPFTPQQVVDYLARRFPDPAHTDVTTPAPLDPRWESVAEEILEHADGVLAATLSSPWRLFVAVTTYHSAVSSPAELVRLAAGHGTTLHDHLIAHLVPAVVEQHPRSASRRYSATDVVRWLSVLAGFLAAERDRGYSGTDLYPDQLWRIAGRRLPRLLHLGVAVGPLLAAAAVLVESGWSEPADAAWLVLASAIPAFLAFPEHRRPIRGDLRRLLRPQRMKLAGFGFLLVAGLAVGAAASAAGDLSGNVSALTAGLVAGAISGGLVGAVGASYRGPVSGAVAASAAFGVAWCVAFGVAVSVTFGWVGIALFAVVVSIVVILLDSTRANDGLYIFLTRYIPADMVVGLGAGMGTSVGVGIGFNIVIGIAFGAASAIGGGLTSWLLRGALSGIVTGTVFVLGDSARPIGRPSRVLLDDLVVAGVVGVLVGLMSGVVGGPVFGVAFGAVGGVVGAFSIGTGLAAVTRFAMACPILAQRRVLPFRLASFLDWAYAAGLLRISGIACQFRHIELQDWASRQISRPG